MNPPTVGHAKVVETMREIAKGDPCFLFATRSRDEERNPLTPAQKVDFLRRAFPDIRVEDTVHAFSAAKKLAEDGFDEATIVLGEDRADLAYALAARASEVGLKAITVRLVGRKTEDASATAARAAALANDRAAFAALCASREDAYVSDLFRAVRHGMGV